LIAILAVALLQGLLYVSVVPPWQHYDEPTHFEYAWLIAHLGRRPHAGDENVIMRREVQASMATYGHFGVHPSLLDDDASRVWIGYSELGHPPGYYALAAIPLASFPYLDVTSQLYLARMVSVVLFVATVAIAWGIAKELTSPDDPLRWCVPLIVALLPTFADVMTSVNSDVGAVFALSLFVWGALRLILRGPSVGRLGWVLGSAALCMAMKNTAMYGVALVPVAILLALFARWQWRIRWLLLGLCGLIAGILLALFGWGDASTWYRSDTALTQPTASRAASEQAVLGRYAFVLDADSSSPERRLVYPLRDAAVSALAGKTVTLAGWVWATREVQLAPLSLDVASKGSATFQRLGRSVMVSTQPTFFAQALTLPTDSVRAQATLTAALVTPEDPGLRVYFDAVTLVAGAFESAGPPVFGDAQASHGTWNGVPFTNLLANGSAETGWPRPRSWLDDRVRTTIRHRPSTTVISLIDAERIWPLIAKWAVPVAVNGLIDRYAWGQVRLEHQGWIYGLRGLLGLALAGCVWKLATLRHRSMQWRAALLFLLLVAISVWGVSIMRPLPALGLVLNAPATRYTFPAIIAMVVLISGGWLALWAQRWRAMAAAVLIVLVLLLNVAALVTIRSFYAAQDTAFAAVERWV